MFQSRDVRPEVRKHQIYHMSEVTEKIRNNVEEAIFLVSAIYKKCLIQNLSFRMWKWEWYLSILQRSNDCPYCRQNVINIFDKKSSQIPSICVFLYESQEFLQEWLDLIINILDNHSYHPVHDDLWSNYLTRVLICSLLGCWKTCTFQKQTKTFVLRNNCDERVRTV